MTEPEEQSTARAKSSSLNYMPHIDGLRAIAVLSVLLFHLDVSIFKGGFIGVDIFFVISGFLITQIISRQMVEGRFSFWHFYARRVKRIFPALFTMLFFSSFGAILLLGPIDFGHFFKALRMASGQISNFHFAQEVDYFSIGHENAALLHTWSLGVEEQFYLVWPFLLFLSYKLKSRYAAAISLVLIFVLSLGLSEYLVRTDMMQAFYMLHARAWQLALGGLIGIGVFKPLRSYLVANILSLTGVCMTLASVLYLDTAHFPGLRALLPCLGCGFIIYAAQTCSGQNTLTTRLLSAKPLVLTGLISYSLYLWHWPLISFYKGYFSEDLSFTVGVCITVTTFMLSFLTYKLIEQPIRHCNTSNKMTLMLGATVIVSFILGANIIKNESKASWRVNYNMDESIFKGHALNKVCLVEGGAYNTESCIIGSKKETYEAILSGDSQAWNYRAALTQWAKDNDITLRLFMRSACPSWVLHDKPRIRNGKPDITCQTLAQDFHDLIVNSSHIKYVFISNLHPKGTEDERRSLERLAASGKAIIFLGQIPLYKSDPHQCRIKDNLMISRWFPRKEKCNALLHTHSNERIKEEQKTLRPLLDKHYISFFDPLPFMPNAEDEHGNFMYKDRSHINKYGANHLAPHLSSFINRSAQN